jgi:hypothetical protein
MAISRRNFLAYLSSSLAGCASSVNLTKSKHLSYPIKTPQGILKRFFTNEAYNTMKDIPVLEPWWLPFDTAGFASSGSFRDSIGGILCGIGPGKKIGYIESKAVSEISILIHEYAHQGHYAGLVKTEDVLPKFETLRTWERKKKIYSQIMEDSKLNFINKLVGIDVNLEIVANLAEYMIQHPQNIPLNLHQAYSRLLRVSEEIVNSEEDHRVMIKEDNYSGLRH